MPRRWIAAVAYGAFLGLVILVQWSASPVDDDHSLSRPIIHVNREPSGPSLKPTQRWPLDLIRLPRAWDVTTGGAQGPLVAIIDTGVTETNDLTGRVSGTSFVTGSAIADQFGHGTEVAGIVAASGSDGSGLVGACWTCRILSLRVSENGDVDPSAIVVALDAARAAGVSVINMSLGSYLHTIAEREAIARAIAAGIVIVASVGNDGSSVPSFPAAYAGVLSVGAVGQDGKLADFSNHGSWVSVLAPACGAALGRDGRENLDFCGTSAAAPFVSGLAALLKSVAPQAKGPAIVAAIQRSARPREGSLHGLIDARAALAAMKTIKPSVGIETKPPLVRNVRKPMMSGAAAVGGRLLASTGAWSGPLTAISLRWERCSFAGKRCRVVVRGKSVYRVGKADVGHGVRVVARAVGEDDRAVEASSRVLRVRR